MSTQEHQAGHLTGREPALGVILEHAMAGDDEALSALLGLLKSKYGRGILGNLRRLRSQAHTQTLEDVLQDSFLELTRRIKEGELGDLPGDEQESIVKYFQWLCDGKLANAVRARKRFMLARKKLKTPEGVIESDPALVAETAGSIAEAQSPGDRHRALLGNAIQRLDRTERRVLERMLAGAPQAEIAKEIGKSDVAVRLMVHHAKRKLLLDIAPGSPTAKARLERLEEAKRRVPSLSEVRLAVESLPVELRQAVSLVHLDGGTLDQLARELGDRGYEKAQARLKTAYRSLSGKLRLPFPETFEKIAR